MGIDAIAEKSHLVLPRLEEEEVNCHVTSLPVGDASDIPVVATAVGNRHMLTHPAIQGHRLIPYSGDGGDKCERLRLTHIVGGAVAQHVERGIEHHVERQLTTAGALAHRLGVDRPVVAARGVTHRSLRVVHRSRRHPDKRDGDVVGDHIDTLVRPLRVLQAIHPLKIEDVGPGAVQAGRFVDAVKI